MEPLHVFSPAKINLFLAVTGRRADGFHALVSVAAPLDFGDGLVVEPNRSGRFELRCNLTELATDESNLILRAARAFAERTGWRGGAAVELDKRIPLGAGLGGGSSNAVAMLTALNQLAGRPLDARSLAELAATLGSDCPLFVSGGPVVMRGRGEHVEALSAGAASRLVGRRVLVFKPAFGVNTAWAYQRLAAQAADAAADETSSAPSPYVSAEDAEDRLAAWCNDPTAPVEALLFNSLEQVAFGKHLALPALLARLAREHDWVARMSGSGSACFGFLPDDRLVEPLVATIRSAWGETAWWVTGRITGPA